MVMKMVVHSICTSSLSDCLLSSSAAGGDEIVASMKIIIYVWTAMPSEKRMARSSSQQVIKVDVHSVCIASLK